jgi:hypothetical protein
VTLENVGGGWTQDGQQRTKVGFASLPTAISVSATVSGDIDLSFPGVGRCSPSAEWREQPTSHSRSWQNCRRRASATGRSEIGPRGCFRHQLGGRTKAVIGGAASSRRHGEQRHAIRER